MSLNYLTKRAISKNNKSALPDWVSEKNATLLAYKNIIQLKAEKLEYIAKHNQAIDYKKKGNYQITAAEVARNIKIATTTLISTSAYSTDLKLFLESINKDLESRKSTTLNTHKRTLAAGMKQRKKDEIRVELQKAKAELGELKKKNATEQVKYVLNALSLPVKQKLGI